MFAQRKTPSENGCNGLSTSLRISMVAGVKHKLSAAITTNSTIKNIISLVSQLREQAPGWAINVDSL